MIKQAKRAILHRALSVCESNKIKKYIYVGHFGREEADDGDDTALISPTGNGTLPECQSRFLPRDNPLFLLLFSNSFFIVPHLFSSQSANDWLLGTLAAITEERKK